MTNQDRRRVYAKGIPLDVAHLCIDWDEEGNLRDHHIAFIDLRDLERRADSLNHPSRDTDNSVKFPSHDEISEFVRSGGVICVYLPQNLDFMIGGEDYHSLDWLPFETLTLQEEGDSVNINNLGEEWDWYFDDPFEWSYLFEGTSDWRIFSHRISDTKIKPIAKNRGGQKIAVSVLVPKSDWEGSVLLIPPDERWESAEFARYTLNKVFEQDVDLESPSPPEWIKEHTVGEETAFKEQIDSLKEDIKEIESSIEEISKFKKLLYEDGDEFEEIVRKSLEKVGLEVTGEVPGRRDGTIETEERVLTLEAYGSDGGVKLEKCRQLEDWVGNTQDEYDKDVSGILVPNPFRRREPASRDLSIPGNVENFMEIRGFSILFSHELFNVVDLYLREEVTTSEIEGWINQDTLVYDSNLL